MRSSRRPLPNKEIASKTMCCPSELNRLANNRAGYLHEAIEDRDEEANV